MPKTKNQFIAPVHSYVPPLATGGFDGGLPLQRRWINRRDDLKDKMEQCLALGSDPRAGAMECWKAQSLTEEPVCFSFHILRLIAADVLVLKRRIVRMIV